MGKIDKAFRAAERRFDAADNEEEKKLLKKVMRDLVGGTQVIT